MQTRFSRLSFFNNRMGWSGGVRVCREKRERLPRLSGEEKHSRKNQKKTNKHIDMFPFFHGFVAPDFNVNPCLERYGMVADLYRSQAVNVWHDVRWNSARHRWMFTRDAQATANWPDLTRFYSRAASSGTAHRAHKHTLRAGTLAEMTTETYSAIRPLYPAWSWWDYQVRGRLPFVFSSSVIVTHFLCFLIVNLICLQVNESDADDQDFGDYALDFMAGEQSTFTS